MNKKNTRIIIIISVLSIATLVKSQKSPERNLSMIIEIISPGTRTTNPLYYKTGPPDWITKYGIFQTTSVGFRQHYIMGLQLRDIYNDFFSKIELKNREIGVLSASHNSSVTSAFAHLTGLLKLPNKVDLPFEDEKDPRYRPNFEGIQDEDMIFNSKNSNLIEAEDLKIEVIPYDEDPIFQLILKNNCKAGNRERYLQELNYVNGLKDTKKESEYVENQLNLTNFKSNIGIINCRLAGVVALSEFFNNDPEKKIDFENNENFKTTGNCFKSFLTAYLATDDIGKTYGSPLMIEILDKLTKKEQSEKSKSKENSKGEYLNLPSKYLLYSGLEESILENLITLGVFSRKCSYNQLKTGEKDPSCLEFPITANSIIYEFEFDQKNQKGIVNVKFNGEYIQVCSDSDIIDQEKKSCWLDVFSQKVQNEVNPDWRKSCGKFFEVETQDNGKYQVVTVLLFSGIIGLIVMIVGVIMIKWKIDDGKSNNGKYGG